jgi:hypothetical protein
MTDILAQYVIHVIFFCFRGRLTGLTTLRMAYAHPAGATQIDSAYTNASPHSQINDTHTGIYYYRDITIHTLCDSQIAPWVASPQDGAVCWAAWRRFCLACENDTLCLRDIASVCENDDAIRIARDLLVGCASADPAFAEIAPPAAKPD